MKRQQPNQETRKCDGDRDADEKVEYGLDSQVKIAHGERQARRHDRSHQRRNEHGADNHGRAALDQSESGDAGGKEDLEPIAQAVDRGGCENLFVDLRFSARVNAKPRLKARPSDIGRTNLVRIGQCLQYARAC